MAEQPNGQAAGRRWTLLTNYGGCLVFLAQRPDATVREIARALGITERAASRILRELRGTGYLSARRVGRRNVYDLHPEPPLLHPVGRERLVRDLLVGLVERQRAAAAPGAGPTGLEALAPGQAVPRTAEPTASA